jgi:hypothetical protein
MKLYNITLNSISPPLTGYTIYYNSVNASTIAKIGLTTNNATNLTKAQLVTPGLRVSVPDNATSVILYNAECATSVVNTITPNLGITASATNITDTSCTIDWVTSTSVPLGTQFLLYMNGVVIYTGTGQFTYDVTGLTAETTYNFAVQAKDVNGNVIGVSNAVIVTTDITIPLIFRIEFTGDPGVYGNNGGPFRIFDGPANAQVTLFLDSVTQDSPRTWVLKENAITVQSGSFPINSPVYYANLDANGESGEFLITTGGGQMTGSLFIIVFECINPNTQQPYPLPQSPYDMLDQQL